MINTVTIERLKNSDGTMPSNSVTLPGSYTVKGKLRILDEMNEVRTVDIVDKDRNGNIVRHNVSSINFDKQHPKRVYTYDDESKEAYHKNTTKAIDLFFGEHPLTWVNGKPHANSSPAAMFNVVSMKDESIGNLNRFKDVLAAANKIDSMTLEEKRNVSYYYGIAPDGKTEADLTVLLGNFQDGICTRPLSVNDFLKTWGTASNVDRDMTVVLKKAVTLNVIVNKVIDGRANYYLGDQLIGTSENDLLSYSKNNTKVYEEFILRTVKEKDIVDTGEKKVKGKSEKPAAEKIYTYMDIKEFREDAVTLKKEGFIPADFNEVTATNDVLVSTVENAKQKQKQLQDA